jgi:hypothetical protein
MELTGHAVGAATDAVLGPKEPARPVSGDAMLAKAEVTCAEQKLSQADCERVKASTSAATDLALRVQAIQGAADEARKREREAAMQPGNIARDILGGAIGHEMMLQRIGF